MCLFRDEKKEIPKDKYSKGYKLVFKDKRRYKSIIFGNVLYKVGKQYTGRRNGPTLAWDGGFYFYKTKSKALREKINRVPSLVIVECEVKDCIAEDKHTFVAKHMTIVREV